MMKPKMPPTTRSKGKAPAAPAGRVYESTPTPAQVEFPARRRTVKTYRKQPQKLLRQQTLTQIGYVGTPPPQELEDSPTKDERPEKRRKTMGDAPNSSFHTQTLTQLISELGKDEFHEDEFDDDMLLLSDHENENVTPQDGPYSEGSKAKGKGKGKRKAPMPKKAKKALSHVMDSRAASMIPQTPAKNKRDPYEVPSSQPTPDTPLDLPKYRIQAYRSPLKDKEPNVNNVTPQALPTVSKRPRDMVIQDSYSSAGLLSSDPIQTPVKSSLPTSSAASGASAGRTRESALLGELTARRIPFAGGTPTQQVPMVNNRRVLGELDPRTVSERVVPDSDDELDSLGPTPVKSVISISSFSTPIRTRPPPAPTTPIIIAEDDDQTMGDSDDDLDPGSPTPVARRVHANPQPSQIELQVSKHNHLSLHDEPAAVATTPTPGPQSTSPGQSQPPRQSQPSQPRFQLYPGQEPGAAVLSEIKLPHGGLYPSFYTTKLGDLGPTAPKVIHTTETLVPSERPVQGSSRGGIPTAQAPPSSYSVPPPIPPGGPPGYIMSGNDDDGWSFRPVRAPVTNPETAAAASSSATRVPAQVIEISHDSPVPLPRPKSQAKVPDSTQVTQSQRSQRSTRARPAQESNTTVSTQSSSQDQVPDTPLPPRRVRIEVPQGSMDVERVEVTAGTSPQQSSPAKHQTQPTQARSQYYSQGLESQRVPLEIIRSLGPQTNRTDITLSIHPEPAELIAKGVKHYEFRNYKLPVSRIWLYITAPVSELRFMATIGPAKEPGEIPSGGVGNDEFNAGRSSKYAHELLQVYVLNNPVPLKMIRERGVFQTPPQKYQYLPPAIVGELLGNLRCALFDSQHGLHHDDDEQDLQPGLHTSPAKLPEPVSEPAREATASQQDATVSQQIEEQLRSDIILATSQAQPPLPREPTEIAQSSQSQYLPIAQTSPAEVRKLDDNRCARLQIPASQMIKTPHHHIRFRDYNTIRPSQATTASEPSSPVISPEKSVPIQRPFLASSGPSFPDFVGETQFSPLRATQQESFDLGSSQVPALPESLFVDDDIRPPADVLWDSEDDEDDKI